MRDHRGHRPRRAEFTRSREAVREQLAFYGTTPAYAPVFELEGYGDLHPILKAMAKENRWSEMSPLIDDDLIDAIAVVGPPDEIAAKSKRGSTGSRGR